MTRDEIYDRIMCDDGCWEWVGGATTLGYGHVRHEGQHHYVHRLVYQWLVGPLLRTDWVLHSCDNPRCVNPAHLRIGTPKDNTQDSIARGRHAWQKYPHLRGRKRRK